MNLRIINFLLLGTFSSFLFAEDFSIIGQVDNVIFLSKSRNESYYRNEIIASLCRDYIAQYYPPKAAVPIYLILGDNLEMTFSVEIENLEGNSWDKDIQAQEFREIGVRIQGQFDYGCGAKVLNLLDYCLNNWSEFEALRNNVLRSRYPYKSKSISQEKILQIINRKPTSRINRIISQKIRRGSINSLPKDKLGSIYYYQNDKFLFEFNGKVVLSLDSIYQILKINRNSWILFETNSKLHFLDSKNSIRNKDYFIPELEGYAYSFKISKRYLLVKMISISFFDEFGDKREIKTMFEYRNGRSLKKWESISLTCRC